jgi:hypothetical protein
MLARGSNTVPCTNMTDLIFLILPIKVHPLSWDERVEPWRVRENDAGIPPDVTHGSSVTENKL